MVYKFRCCVFSIACMMYGLTYLLWLFKFCIPNFAFCHPLRNPGMHSTYQRCSLLSVVCWLHFLITSADKAATHLCWCKLPANVICWLLCTAHSQSDAWFSEPQGLLPESTVVRWNSSPCLHCWYQSIWKKCCSQITSRFSPLGGCVLARLEDSDLVERDSGS